MDGSEVNTVKCGCQSYVIHNGGGEGGEGDNTETGSLLYWSQLVRFAFSVGVTGLHMFAYQHWPDLHVLLCCGNML